MAPKAQEMVRNRRHDNPLIDDEPHLVCTNCYRCIMDGRRIPLEANANGPPRLPDLPDELIGLNEVETLLISARVLFQKIAQRPRGGQVALKGAYSHLINTVLCQ